MAIYYSISNSGFYNDVFKHDYDAAESWPTDAVELTPEQAALLYESVNSGCRIYKDGDDLVVSAPKPGKYHSWDENNLCWIVSDADAEQQLHDNIELAKQQKSALMNNASISITPLQDAIDLGIDTDEEASLLAEWKNYRVQLMRVDTSAAPDIDWPPIPE